MRFRLRFRPGLALAAVTSLAAAASAVSQVQSNSVELRVSVGDRDSRPLAGLGADDFKVLEDGVERPVTSASRIPQDAPMAFALLLDASNSAEADLARTQKVAIDFARRLRPSDVAEVISFNTRVERLEPFTRDVARLEQAIAGMRLQGATSLYNALYTKLREVEKQARTTPGLPRQVLIVLSDGEDTSSLVPYASLLDLTRRSEATIYAITPYNRKSPAAGSAVRQLAEESGGRQFVPAAPGEFAAICDLVWNDLSNQYLVRYDAGDAPRKDRWRRLDVTVKVPGAKVRTRSRHFASGS